MADDDLNTECSEKDNAEEAAAEKAFQASFKENEGSREGSVRMIGGDDADDDTDDDSSDDDDSNDADDDTGDDDQGDDDAGTGDDTQSGGDGKDRQADKGKGEAEPTIKDVIAMVQGMQTGMVRQLSTMQSKLDKGLRPADVTAATKTAADAAKDAGKKVPTKERVETALKSVKGFADMEKDFPDYAVVLRESLTMLASEMEADKGAVAVPVDENALVDKAVAKIRHQDQQTQAAQKEVEAETAKIETVWPDFKTVINSEPFKKWRKEKESGAQSAEYLHIFSKGSTRETLSAMADFSQETGIKPKSKDGTQSAGNGNQQQQASNKNNDRRRRSASRPRGSAPAIERADSEEDAFQRSFKEKRGG